MRSGGLILTYAEWEAEGVRRFGPNKMKWKFVCPACGFIASAEDYKNAGAPSMVVGFSCIGRWLPYAREAFAKGDGPCNYAGGGLFRLNPLEVDGAHFFDFAPGEIDHENN